MSKRGVVMDGDFKGCPHHEKWTPFFVQPNETDRRQDLRLSEGMCPNRCGPFKKAGVTTAECECCGFKWTSVRVTTIFPEPRDKKKEEEHGV